ncbi:MAG: hypothetical protein ABI347_11545 [Nitrososphaera sp.]|jgi:hypothetical protein
MEEKEDDMKKERQESNPQYRNRADILEKYARRLRNGEQVGMPELLESIVSDIMKLLPVPFPCLLFGSSHGRCGSCYSTPLA